MEFHDAFMEFSGIVCFQTLANMEFLPSNIGFKFHTHYDFNQPFCGGSVMNYMNYLKKNNKDIELICRNDAYGFTVTDLFNW